MADRDGATPVIIACQNGNFNQLSALLTHGASASDRDIHGRTALHHCVDSRDTACAELLLRSDPSLLAAADDEGLTPLHMAVIAANVTVIRLLLKRGASLSCRDHQLHTVAHWATVCGHASVLDVLLEYDADLASPDTHGACPVHYAAQLLRPAQADSGDVTGSQGNARQDAHRNPNPNPNFRLLRKLLDHGVSPEVRDKDMRTPIIWAGSAGNPDACRMLVAAGADVNAADKDGLTALHCAASRGHTECVQVLVSVCKARTDPVDQNYCTPLFYAITLGHHETAGALLNLGSQASHTDSRGRSTAHCAALEGSRDTLESLKHQGVDLWRPALKGDYAVHEAAQAGHVEIVEYLLDERAADKHCVDVSNKEGRTCLHIAALTNNLRLAKVLLDRGAKVNSIMTTKGKSYTCYDAAVAKGQKEAAEYLLFRGGLPATEVTARLKVAEEKKSDDKLLSTDDLSQPRDRPPSAHARVGDMQASVVAVVVLTSSPARESCSPSSMLGQADSGRVTSVSDTTPPGGANTAASDNEQTQLQPDRAPPGGADLATSLMSTAHDGVGDSERGEPHGGPATDCGATPVRTTRKASSADMTVARALVNEDIRETPSVRGNTLTSKTVTTNTEDSPPSQIGATTTTAVRRDAPIVNTGQKELTDTKDITGLEMKNTPTAQITKTLATKTGDMATVNIGQKGLTDTENTPGCEKNTLAIDLLDVATRNTVKKQMATTEDKPVTHVGKPLSSRTTDTPTDRNTDTPTVRNTDTPTKSNTYTPTVRNIDTPTISNTDTPTARNTDTPTVSNTDTPTVRNTDMLINSTDTPTNTTDTPTTNTTDTPTTNTTDTATVSNTNTPIIKSTDTPTTNSTDTPTISNTDTPTVRNTDTPTVRNTDTPTVSNTDTPTVRNTMLNSTDTPTTNTTDTPTASNTNTPILKSTDTPTTNSTDTPTTNSADTPIINSTDTPTVNSIDTPTISNSGTPTISGSDDDDNDDKDAIGDIANPTIKKRLSGEEVEKKSACKVLKRKGLLTLTGGRKLSACRRAEGKGTGGKEDRPKGAPSSRLVLEVQASVRRFDEERRSIRAFQQMKRAHMQSSPARDLALLRCLMHVEGFRSCVQAPSCSKHVHDTRPNPKDMNIRISKCSSKARLLQRHGTQRQECGAGGIGRCRSPQTSSLTDHREPSEELSPRMLLKEWQQEQHIKAQRRLVLAYNHHPLPAIMTSGKQRASTRSSQTDTRPSASKSHSMSASRPHTDRPKSTATSVTRPGPLGVSRAQLGFVRQASSAGKSRAARLLLLQPIKGQS